MKATLCMFDFEAINIRHGTNLYKSTKGLFSIVKSVTQVVPDKKNEKKRLKCENDKFGDAGESKTKGSSSSNLKKSHGILNMLGWGIIIPIGAMVARYMKPWDPVWFYSHSLLQSLGFLFGVSGIVCGFVLENRLGVDVDKHKSLGVFILTLGCLQVPFFFFSTTSARLLFVMYSLLSSLAC